MIIRLRLGNLEIGVKRKKQTSWETTDIVKTLVYSREGRIRRRGRFNCMANGSSLAAIYVLCRVARVSCRVAIATDGAFVTGLPCFAKPDSRLLQLHENRP